MKTIQILIADDHELVRKGLRTVLEAQPGWKVCGEAVNGRQAVELAKKLQPDVIVMDVTMPELNGLEATRQIRKALPRAEVLILTIHESDQLASEALAAVTSAPAVSPGRAPREATRSRRPSTHTSWFSPARCAQSRRKLTAEIRRVFRLEHADDEEGTA